MSPSSVRRAQIAPASEARSGSPGSLPSTRPMPSAAASRSDVLRYTRYCPSPGQVRASSLAPVASRRPDHSSAGPVRTTGDGRGSCTATTEVATLDCTPAVSVNTASTATSTDCAGDVGGTSKNSSIPAWAATVLVSPATVSVRLTMGNAPASSDFGSSTDTLISPGDRALVSARSSAAVRTWICGTGGRGAGRGGNGADTEAGVPHRPNRSARTTCQVAGSGGTALSDRVLGRSPVIVVTGASFGTRPANNATARPPSNRCLLPESGASRARATGPAGGAPCSRICCCHVSFPPSHRPGGVDNDGASGRSGVAPTPAASGRKRISRGLLYLSCTAVRSNSAAARLARTWLRDVSTGMTSRSRHGPSRLVRWIPKNAPTTTTNGRSPRGGSAGSTVARPR